MNSLLEIRATATEVRAIVAAQHGSLSARSPAQSPRGPAARVRASTEELGAIFLHFFEVKRSGRHDRAALVINAHVIQAADRLRARSHADRVRKLQIRAGVPDLQQVRLIHVGPQQQLIPAHRFSAIEPE